MPIRKAEAEWKGNLVDGAGRLKVASGAFEGPYSFKSRVEEGQSATNPEELIGAAHAGCFTMALTAQLSQKGITPNRIHTIAAVKLDTKLGMHLRSRALSFRRKRRSLASMTRHSRRLRLMRSKTVQCRKLWLGQKFI
jgi:OsmC subfamily peroxiredoxin